MRDLRLRGLDVVVTVRDAPLGGEGQGGANAGWMEALWKPLFTPESIKQQQSQPSKVRIRKVSGGDSGR